MPIKDVIIEIFKKYEGWNALDDLKMRRFDNLKNEITNVQ